MSTGTYPQGSFDGTMPLDFSILMFSSRTCLRMELPIKPKRWRRVSAEGMAWQMPRAAVAVFDEAALAEDCAHNSKPAAWNDALICKLNRDIFSHGGLRDLFFH